MGELQQVTNLFDMTTDCKVTELFCIIDEFCKHFDAENAGNLLEDNSGMIFPDDFVTKTSWQQRLVGILL